MAYSGYCYAQICINLKCSCCPLVGRMTWKLWSISCLSSTRLERLWQVHGCREFGPSRLVLEGSRPVEVENRLLECVYFGALSDQLTAEMRTENCRVRNFCRLPFPDRWNVAVSKSKVPGNRQNFVSIQRSLLIATFCWLALSYLVSLLTVCTAHTKSCSHMAEPMYVLPFAPSHPWRIHLVGLSKTPGKKQ